MPKFSALSQSRLNMCHPDLKAIFQKVIQDFDCSILEGHRDEATQSLYFKEGKSKVQYPFSKHNRLPSLAVDAAPYPVDWNDKKRFCFFAGYVMGVAKMLKIKLCWGGDWDNDKDLKDQTFNDLVHFELIV
jgi:peptidoglycan L-alanyl-D-glutamate endopeptidase CwlK